MLYDLITQEEALSILQSKMLGASDAIVYLIHEGYIPNKNKYTTLAWSQALIKTYEHIDVLSDEQCVKLNILYNKIIDM